MKQISIALNVILMSILIFLGCSASRNTAVSNTIPASRAFTVCYNCDTDVFYGLTKDDLIDGISRYRKTHWNLINSDKMRDALQPHRQADSRACWYSLDTLKKFICLIEKYTKGFKKIDPHTLGIRFYFAVYKSSGTWDPEYNSCMTLFMVPTYENIDFDPRSSSNLNSIQTYDNMASSVQPLVLDGTTANRELTSMAKNQGQLCPPNPNCPPKSAIAKADETNPHGISYK